MEIFPLSAKSFVLDLQKKGMEWYQEHVCISEPEPTRQKNFHVAQGRVHKGTLKTSKMQGRTVFEHNYILRVNFEIC